MSVALEDGVPEKGGPEKEQDQRQDSEGELHRFKLKPWLWRPGSAPV